MQNLQDWGVMEFGGADGDSDAGGGDEEVAIRLAGSQEASTEICIKGECAGERNC